MRGADFTQNNLQINPPYTNPFVQQGKQLCSHSSFSSYSMMQFLKTSPPISQPSYTPHSQLSHVAELNTPCQGMEGGTSTP